MRPLLAFLLALALTGCAGLAAFHDGDSRAVVVTGTVSSVQLTSNNGGTITIVTLINNGLPGQFTFCGNTVSQFPMDSLVRVTFTPGQDCNQIVLVVIL